MKNISKAKIKAANQEERLQKWQELFNNLQGNTTEITDKPAEKIFIAK